MRPQVSGEIAFQVHADQVELQPERGEVLAHRVVQELGDHVALEFLGLERAQHGVAQLLLGLAPRRDFPRQPAGVADLRLPARIGKTEMCQVALPRRSRSVKVSPSSARAKRLAPGGGQHPDRRASATVAPLQFRRRLAEDRRGLAVDALETPGPGRRSSDTPGSAPGSSRQQSGMLGMGRISRYLRATTLRTAAATSRATSPYFSSNSSGWPDSA